MILFIPTSQIIWKTGHVYIGSWKDGKMDGIDEFKYRDVLTKMISLKKKYVIQKKKVFFTK